MNENTKGSERSSSLLVITQPAKADQDPKLALSALAPSLPSHDHSAHLMAERVLAGSISTVSFPSSCSQFDQKEQKSFLRPRKDYWDFLCAALWQQRGDTEPVRFVHSLDKVSRAGWQGG